MNGPIDDFRSYREYEPQPLRPLEKIREDIAGRR